jgi:hypothetical protein
VVATDREFFVTQHDGLATRDNAVGATEKALSYQVNDCLGQLFWVFDAAPQ